MNREQKAATIEAIAAEIDAAEAVFAVDYRGISVPQAAELRTKLREAETSFTVVKNSLTERAADQVGAESLKPLLSGPTALAFVRGDAAMAAKAIADYARATQLLPFKGGLLNGEALQADQIRAISRLPAREVLYGQLVGIVASPVSGLVRTLNALVGGLAVALGQVQAKKESGEIPSGDAPATQAAPAEAEAASAQEAAAEEPQTEESPAAEESQAEEAQAEETPVEEAAAEEPQAKEPLAEQPQAEETSAEEASAADQAEPAELAQDDKQADASEQEPDGAEATKED
ncbi:MAG TPA: 50S ribosomal protein L10 [Solirubrobacteraceae bacterium]|nr:50S ribosomal protein L10 [Solirubrobacteraceae bacterium]